MLQRWQSVPTPDAFVFIVGCTNSGTTLLHTLVSRHPRVGSLPAEGQFYTRELRRPWVVGPARLWALDPGPYRLSEDDTGVDVNKIKRQWAAMFDDPSMPVLVERTPVNLLRVRWLDRNFAPARFIGLVRHGAAVAEGIHRRTGHSMEDCARQWVMATEILLDDAAQMDNYLIVKYEDLTHDVERTLTRVWPFIGLENPPQGSMPDTLKVHERDTEVRNLNAESLGRLGARDAEVIRSVGGDLLLRLGYRWPEAQPAPAHRRGTGSS